MGHEISYYDRATNMTLDTNTNPARCIEPVAMLKTYHNGKKYAKLIKMPTTKKTYHYSRSWLQKLLKKPALKCQRTEFDFETAHSILTAKQHVTGE